MVQIALYLLLWLLNDYLATMLSLIFGSIALMVLLIALIVEWIERSKVSRWFFWVMGFSVVAPLVVALLFGFINGGIEWLAER